MSFKQLAVRTKKSISGLYSSSNDQEAIGTQASDRNIDNIHKLRESPSRRKRLIGSFRSLRHPSTKMGVESPVRTDSPRTPVRGFPSLALNFEASPPGRPMFDTSTRKTSPITMPMANAPTAISSSKYTQNFTFAVGSLPVSPAPLQRASVQRAIIAASSPTIDIGSAENVVRFDPIPTPMPGTNLSLEDIAPPEIVVQSPSVPSMNLDYFTIPLSSKEMQEQRGNVVTSDPLLTDDREFDEVVAMAAASQSLLGKLDPIQPSGVAESLTEDEFALDSRKGSPLQAASPKGSEIDDIGAYMVYDNPAAVRDGQVQRENPTGMQSHHDNCIGSECTSTDFVTLIQRCDNTPRRGSHSPSVTHLPGPSSTLSSFPSSRTHSTDNTEAETASTDPTLHDGEKPLVIAEIPPFKIEPVEEEPRSSIDESKELQDIIHAYAGPMLYQLDRDEEQATEFSSQLLAEEEIVLGEMLSAEVKADVDLSIRILNRSLGG